MNDTQKTRFVVFCLEAYKQRHALTGRQAADLFEQYGITDYLQDGYDVLHSLGQDALVDDLDDYLQRRQHQKMAEDLIVETNKLAKQDDVPVFCWDRPWTAQQIRQRLANAQGVERDLLMAWIMREAAFRDVWVFLRPQEVYNAWPRLAPFLGRWKAFWTYILGTWHELGKI